MPLVLIACPTTLDLVSTGDHAVELAETDRLNVGAEPGRERPRPSPEEPKPPGPKFQKCPGSNGGRVALRSPRRASGRTLPTACPVVEVDHHPVVRT